MRHVNSMILAPVLLGHTRSGAPIWSMAGGADDDGGTAEGGDQGGDDGGGVGDDDGAGADNSDDDGDPDGAEHLGDPGKRALDAMKSERNAAREQLRTWSSVADEFGLTPEKVRELAAAAASKDGTVDVEKIRTEARNEATQVYGRVALRAEVKAQATGKLADPQDALAFIDLSTFEISEDGEVDEAAIGTAIDALLEKKPHLAAQGSTWQGSGDGGPRDTVMPEVSPGLPRLRDAYANASK